MRYILCKSALQDFKTVQYFHCYFHNSVMETQKMLSIS